MKRSNISKFCDIPNVGPATEKKLLALGLRSPRELIGENPYQLYRKLCSITQTRQDPCVLDVFISAVRFMEGGPPRKWWEFTAQRKQHLRHA